MDGWIVNGESKSPTFSLFTSMSKICGLFIYLHEDPPVDQVYPKEFSKTPVDPNKRM